MDLACSLSAEDNLKLEHDVICVNCNSDCVANSHNLTLIARLGPARPGPAAVSARPGQVLPGPDGQSRPRPARQAWIGYAHPGPAALPCPVRLARPIFPGLARPGSARLGSARPGRKGAASAGPAGRARFGPTRPGPAEPCPGRPAQPGRQARPAGPAR